MHHLETVLVLSVMAGSVHVMSPDHWVPASILTWQRRWSGLQASLFVIALLSLHLILGFLVYLGLDSWLAEMDSHRVSHYLTALVFIVMVMRAVRFSSIQKVQQLGNKKWWGVLAVFSLLGPCESLIPILMKSKSLGMGYLLPSLAFAGGTILTGGLLVSFGRIFWNRPVRLTQFFMWVDRRVAVLPITAGLILGIRFLLRLSA